MRVDNATLALRTVSQLGFLFDLLKINTKIILWCNITFSSAYLRRTLHVGAVSDNRALAVAVDAGAGYLLIPIRSTVSV